MSTKDSHILTIKQIYPDATNIDKPCIQGYDHDIHIVTTNKNKFVCRFSDEQMAQHNYYASKLLTQYNIPVPCVSLYSYKGEYCETYPFIEGKTLHERLTEGMSYEKISDVYSQIFDINRKISKVPFESITTTKRPITTKIHANFFNFFNYSKVALCHTDLHAKNIILDDTDNIKTILDLDSFYPEHTAIPVIVTVADAKSYGYKIQNLADICYKENIKQKIFPIETQIKIYNAVKNTTKKILGAFMVKQLLKIRVK